jgi:hypothetical protein
MISESKMGNSLAASTKALFHSADKVSRSQTFERPNHAMQPAAGRLPILNPWMISTLQSQFDQALT